MKSSGMIYSCLFSRKFILVPAALALLMCISGGAALASPIPAVTFSNTVGSDLANPPFTLGWSFTVNSSIIVTDLGVFDSRQNGLNNSYPVGIFDSVGNLLASTTVSIGSADTLINQFRYSAISPIILSAGQDYSIGALYTYSTGVFDGLLFPGSVTGFATDPSITFRRSEFRAGNTLTALPISAGSTDPSYFGPNFLQQPVPEPSTLALLGAGIVGLISYGWKHRK